MNCQQCGQETAPAASFCRACGARLQLRCPSCQTPHNPGDRFCGYCGSALPEAGANDRERDGMVAPPAPVAPPFDQHDPPATPFHPYAPPAQYPAGTDAPTLGAFALGRPGGFWLRLPAYLIDVVIVAAVFLILWLVVLGQPVSSITGTLETGTEDEYDFQTLGRDGLNALLGLVYDTALITIWATTLGKRAFGLYVVRSDGSRVGPGRALARHLATILSLLILGIGFLMIAFRRDKRGLHDLICDTVVIQRRR